MTAPPLPDRPDLDLLRNHAKELLRAVQAGEPKALARCRAAMPRLAGLNDTELASALRLADAQQALAREHGFESWPKLKRHVEGGQPVEPRAEPFLTAIREQNASAAEGLLRQYPAIAHANVFSASCAGAADFLAKALAAEPRLTAARHDPDGWTPLLYLCASPLHASSPTLARRLLRCAELLLKHGAEPNSFVLWDEGDPESRLPALYYACVSDNVALVCLLLERGAEPNDGESIYHAAELNHRDCLEALLAHGADASGRHPHWGNTPLYFLAGYKESHPGCARATEGMRWLLEHGADPNVASLLSGETPLHRAAAFGRSPAVAEMLLAHGAEIDRPRADGCTAYALAVRTGNVPMAHFLRRRGADRGRLTPVDELLGACMEADAARARTLVAHHSGLLARLAPEDRHQALVQAVEQGREASVRLMAELGFGLSWEGTGGGTPLHHAAWHGKWSMVRLLLALGAPVNVRDSQFGCSPLAWAAHGSTHCRDADDDYCAVVELLLEAGADRETAINRWGEPPEAMASQRVARLLKARGFVE